MGLPLADITFNFGLEAIIKSTSPVNLLFSAQKIYKLDINSPINLPLLSVVSVSDINKFFKRGKPLAIIYTPVSPILFPLTSRL
jgi:hypothetical protein